jgi:Alpha/beta hydrolase of unknown function (DUF1400)
MKLFSSLQRSAICLTIALTAVSSTQAAIAASSIVFRYGPFSETISVRELTNFAQTGEPSSKIRYYLRRTKQEPEAVQAILNRQIPARVTTLDRLLNSPVGEITLDRLSETFQAPVEETSRQALRAALVLSASDDDQLSLVEVLNRYPTNELQVDARELINTYNQISELIEPLQNIPNILQ